MKIEEIAPGTQLTVNVLIGTSTVSIKTKAVMAFEGGLLVEPLEYQGHCIESESVGNLDPFQDAEGKTRIFRIDNLIPVHNWGKTFHKLYGAEIIHAENNKRKAERYVINMLGKAVINHTITTNVIVYDISMRGISLMLGRIPIRIKPGDQIAVTFRKENASKPFNVNCRVMREFMVGTYNTVGCQMNGVSPDLLTFILEKRSAKETAKAEQSKSKVTIRGAGTPSIPSTSGAKSFSGNAPVQMPYPAAPYPVASGQNNSGSVMVGMSAFHSGNGNGHYPQNGLPNAYTGY